MPTPTIRTRVVTAAACALALVPAVLPAQSARDAARSYRIAREGAIVRELAELAALPNVASDSAGIRANAAHLLRMLERRGASARLLESPTGGPPAVFGELRVPGATRTVMLYAHYDGQPVVPSEWATPPWTPTLRTRALADGGTPLPLPDSAARVDPEARLYARSASDDKAPIVAMLRALDALRASGIAPSVNVKFFLEGEEEAGSDNLRALLERHAGALAADVWVFADGPRHQSGAVQVVYGVRGVLGAQLTVYGPDRPLHSGHYGNWAPNPAAMLASLLASMRADDGSVTIDGFDDGVRAPTAAERRAIDAIANTDSALAGSLALGRAETADRLLLAISRPAMNVSGLRAGGVGDETANVINTRATAAIDFRLVPAQTPAGVRAAVERHLASRGYHVVHAAPDAATRRAHPRVAHLEWGEGYPGIRTDLAAPAARAVARTVEEAVAGPVLHVPTLGGSLPMAHFAEVLGAPLVIVPIVNADNNQHAANENLRIGNLYDGMDIFAVLLARLGVVWP